VGHLLSARFAFGRERRLRKRADFLRVQSGGLRVTSSHFTFLVAARPEDASAPSRLGVVASRKLGGAVRRNRVKRLCRECFRLWPDLLPEGVDLVVIARAGAETLALREVCAEWSAVERSLRRCAEKALSHPSSARKPEADERMKTEVSPKASRRPEGHGLRSRRRRADGPKGTD
jgi:ribonuclease P protein component